METKNKRKTSYKQNTITTYVPISNNIYHDGYSFRVRVIVNKIKYSKNFNTKSAAIKYRNSFQ